MSTQWFQWKKIIWLARVDFKGRFNPHDFRNYIERNDEDLFKTNFKCSHWSIVGSIRLHWKIKKNVQNCLCRQYRTHLTPITTDQKEEAVNVQERSPSLLIFFIVERIWERRYIKRVFNFCEELRNQKFDAMLRKRNREDPFETRIEWHRYTLRLPVLFYSLFGSAFGCLIIRKGEIRYCNGYFVIFFLVG